MHSAMRAGVMEMVAQVAKSYAQRAAEGRGFPAQKSETRGAASRDTTRATRSSVHDPKDGVVDELVGCGHAVHQGALTIKPIGLTVSVGGLAASGLDDGDATGDVPL